MGFIIEDGGGTGNKAKISVDNQLLTKAVVESAAEFISVDKGLAFSWASGTFNPIAADTILLVKNTSLTRNLHISVIYLSTDVDTRVVVHFPIAEVTPTGTTIVGTNLNRTSANVAEATAIRDETDNTQGDVFWSGEIHAVNDPKEISTDGVIILGTGDSIGIDYVADVAACDVTIVGHFE